MKRKRRTFTPEIKSKIALEAIKEEKTINENAKPYEVHPNQATATRLDEFGDEMALRQSWCAPVRPSCEEMKIYCTLCEEIEKMVLEMNPA